MGHLALRVNSVPRTCILLGRIVFLLPRPPTIAHFLNIPVSTNAVSTPIVRRAGSDLQHCISSSIFRMPVASRNSRRATAKSEPKTIPLPLPPSTQWHRDHGRQTRQDKAIKQQLLTSHEEQAIVDFVLQADRNGYLSKGHVIR
jgi:hypothetical protein